MHAFCFATTVHDGSVSGLETRGGNVSTILNSCGPILYMATRRAATVGIHL